ncbi:MAG TPA: hypothetical protein VJN41_02435 [Alphaproteobacteria bacterium]|nr:hypothetical protein [Alphaproteobacteria bacterium]
MPADKPEPPHKAAEPSIEQALGASDSELIRALEDLIDVLIKKDVIAFTDLPEPVQRKLLSRQALRERLMGSLFAEEDDGAAGLP